MRPLKRLILTLCDACAVDTMSVLDEIKSGRMDSAFKHNGACALTGIKCTMMSGMCVQCKIPLIIAIERLGKKTD
jgi:hypothetical protein